jgi:hypothetical protein
MGNYGGLQNKKSPSSARSVDTDKRGVHTPVNSGKFTPKSKPEAPNGSGPTGN